MATLSDQRPISVDEYLEGEKSSDTRHEFVAGEVRAMVGASEAHNLVAGSFYMALRTHLRGTGCRVFMTNMRLRVANDYYYPDVLVTCSRDDTDPYFKQHPTLIVEVLSPGTVIRDTHEKLMAYQAIASLREYVLAEQDRREVRVHHRSAASWDLAAYAGADTLRLASVDLSLPLDDIYRDILP